MLRQIVDPYVALAFYGVDPRSARDYWELVLEYWIALGLQPDGAALGGNGFSGKSARFATALKAIDKRGFADLEWFSLYVLVPNGKDVERDAVTSAGWVSSNAGLECSAAISSLRDPTLLELANRAALVLDPSYAIGFEMPKKQGPGYYAGGLRYYRSDDEMKNLSPERKREDERTGAWGSIGRSLRVYLEGLLRDVYPWNLLNDTQIANTIDGLSLRDWIHNGADRGQVVHLTDKLWCWTIEAKNIAQARAALSRAGLIFDRDDYLKRKVK